MKKLCCLVHPAVVCACGFRVCEDCWYCKSRREGDGEYTIGIYGGGHFRHHTRLLIWYCNPLNTPMMVDKSSNGVEYFIEAKNVTKEK